MSLRYRLLGLPASLDEFIDRLEEDGADTVKIGRYMRPSRLRSNSYVYAAHPGHDPTGHDSLLDPTLSKDIYLYRPEEHRFTYPVEEQEQTLEEWREVLDGAGFTVREVNVGYP